MVINISLLATSRHTTRSGMPSAQSRQPWAPLKFSNSLACFSWSREAGHEAAVADVAPEPPAGHPLVRPRRVVLLLRQLEHLQLAELRLAGDEGVVRLPALCWAAKDRLSTTLASR